MPKTKRYLPAFTERLETLLNNSDMPYHELAKKLGFERKAISAWKFGASLPDAKAIADLAKIFGVSADWLLGLVDE